MNESIFKECLALYGADLEEWPVIYRREARKLYASSAVIRALLEKEQAFETMLTVRFLPEPGADFTRHILAAATEPSPGIFSRWLGKIQARLEEFTAPQFAYTIAGLVAIGFAVGFSTWQPSSYLTTDSPIGTFLYEEQGSL